MEFELPEAFVSAFETAHGGDARMKVVRQFFQVEEITLGQDDWVSLKPNESHQVYLVGSSSLIHIARQEEGAFYVVQAVPRKQGMIGKGALESQVVSQLKKDRKLWLLTRKAASRLHSRVPPQAAAADQDRVVQTDEGAAAPAIHPDEIVPETSSPKLAAAKDEGEGGHEEINLQAFDQLRTLLQNIRLEFWQGKVRSQPTEAISQAAKKAAENDISGAIQAIEMIENIFARLIEQWEQDFKQAERSMRRGGAEGDSKKLKNFKSHHLNMQSRISQAKAKFRITLNWLRELETKQKREQQQ